MSIESIESLARSFDSELRQLESLSNSSPAHRVSRHIAYHSPDSAPHAGNFLPEHSFELAAAESERERLHDKLNDLSARVEELELHTKHQESIIAHLKKRNRDLETKLQDGDTYKGDESSSDISFSFQDIEKERGGQMYRLKCKALELELQETKILLSQSQKKMEEANSAYQNASTDHQNEVSKRVHAEKQRDAYAAAYRQALQHIEKWSS